MATNDLIEVRVNGKSVRTAVELNRTRQLDRLSRGIVVAARIAKQVRERAQRGQFATAARPYSMHGSYFVSKSYAEQIGAEKRRYQSSADFHAKMRAIPGKVSGGMWTGLRVRNFGVKGAVIEFAGKSLGSQIKARKRGGSNQNVKVANRKKAARVWTRLRLNVIQPTDAEIQAIGTAAMSVVASRVAFGGKTKINPSGDRALARALRRDIEDGRITRYL